MKRIAAIGLVLAAGLGLSACGSHPATKSYIDGWDARVYDNTNGVFDSCNLMYSATNNNFSKDLHSEFMAGCQDAGDSKKTYEQLH